MTKIDLSRSVQSWPGKILVLRALWIFCWPFFRWMPKRFSLLRVLILRVFGANIGERCLIMPGVKILQPWQLSLGDCVAIGESVDLYNFSLIEIGASTVISQRTILCTGSHDYLLSNMPLIYEAIRIGSECWIASDCFVMPGVVISDGVVVGARSLVTKNLDAAWSLYCGHPAKFVKVRTLKD